MDVPGPNTRMGIALAQQGQTFEALSYLRHAVTTEPATADVWLWLAHVTPDIAEYRYCVYQALAIQPNHSTALRMRADVDGQPAATANSPVLQTPERDVARRRVRRWIVLLTVALVIMVGSAALSLLIDSDALLDQLGVRESNHQLEFTVGDEAEAVRFEVTVPRTWYLADSGSPSWRAQRDELQAAFPPEPGQPDFWQAVETDLSAVTWEDEGSRLSTNVSVVETDEAKIRESPAQVARLTLAAVRRQSTTGCEALRTIAAEELPQRQRSEDFIEGGVRERDADECIYVVTYRISVGSAGQQDQITEILLPIGAQRLALWRVRVASSQVERYADTIDTILETLRVSRQSSLNG